MEKRKKTSEKCTDSYRQCEKEMKRIIRKMAAISVGCWFVMAGTVLGEEIDETETELAFAAMDNETENVESETETEAVILEELQIQTGEKTLEKADQMVEAEAAARAALEAQAAAQARAAAQAQQKAFRGKNPPNQAYMRLAVKMFRSAMIRIMERPILHIQMVL
ncbi:MAG: hypothetical protein Q4C59_02410 [Lachnospiraceae bacterium]|nr:hypothetical protein [Lachnospiraceae bacterium]